MEDFLNSYSEYLQTHESSSFFLILGLGFLGGLLSSLLPCVLSLLPVNLAYIGTLKVKNKLDSFWKASEFVAGVVIIMTLLGVFGGLAFAVFTEYRGIINLVVGLIIVLMALALLEVIKIPMPQVVKGVPEAAGPFVVGLVFALVSSPCSSPVLISIISIASNLGSILKSVVLMFGYSIGYTIIIFIASMFTGLMKQLNWFKANSELVIRISAIMLAVIGVFYVYLGIVNL